MSGNNNVQVVFFCLFPVLFAQVHRNDCTYHTCCEACKYLFRSFCATCHINKDLPGLPVFGSKKDTWANGMKPCIFVFGNILEDAHHIAYEIGLFFIEEPLEIIRNHVIGRSMKTEEGDTKKPCCIYPSLVGCREKP